MGEEQVKKWASKVYGTEDVPYDPNLNDADNMRNIGHALKDSETETPGKEYGAEPTSKEVEELTKKSKPTGETRYSREIPEQMMEENQPKEANVWEKVQSTVAQAKDKYIDKPVAHVEKGLGMDIESREARANKNITERKERLRVKEIENEEKALKKREFEESTVGKVLKGIKEHTGSGYNARNEQRYRGGYGKAPKDTSPFHAALRGEGTQSTPFWMKSGTGNPGWMGGNGQSAMMNVMMGVHHNPQIRTKTVTINGRTYVVQQPVNQNQPVQNQSMLDAALFSSSSPHHKEKAHISPLMQSVMGGGAESKSPIAQALFGSSSSHQKTKEKHSPLQSALEGGMFSHKSFGGKKSKELKFW